MYDTLSWMNRNKEQYHHGLSSMTFDSAIPFIISGDIVGSNTYKHTTAINAKKDKYKDKVMIKYIIRAMKTLNNTDIDSMSDRVMAAKTMLNKVVKLSSTKCFKIMAEFIINNLPEIDTKKYKL